MIDKRIDRKKSFLLAFALLSVLAIAWFTLDEDRGITVIPDRTECSYATGVWVSSRDDPFTGSFTICRDFDLDNKCDEELVFENFRLVWAAGHDVADKGKSWDIRRNDLSVFLGVKEFLKGINYRLGIYADYAPNWTMNQTPWASVPNVWIEWGTPGLIFTVYFDDNCDDSINETVMFRLFEVAQVTQDTDGNGTHETTINQDGSLDTSYFTRPSVPPKRPDDESN